MRFVAPERSEVSSAAFEHPAFDGLAGHRRLLSAPEWPAVDDLNALWSTVVQPTEGRLPRFVRQDPGLLADGLHYERRIRDCGRIATRERSWHDLFNALVWIEHTALKTAINRRQADDVDRCGPMTRTRAQCALTHFDEAGVVVLLRDGQLLDLWDRHDWFALFWTGRSAWEDRAQLRVIGHALLEHALVAGQMLVGKALVVIDADLGIDGAIDGIAQAIAAGRLLRDPQELRPLPLSGLPGWHPHNGEAGFHRDAPCYRPLREGRTYPRPIALPHAAPWDPRIQSAHVARRPDPRVP